jgi:hypothetical protein
MCDKIKMGYLECYQLGDGRARGSCCLNSYIGFLITHNVDAIMDMEQLVR